MLPVSLLSILDCPISFLSCVRCCLYLYYPFLIVLSVFFLVSDVACISIIHSWLSHQFLFCVRCCLYLYYPFLITPSVFFLMSAVAYISIIHSWLSHQFSFLCQMVPVSIIHSWLSHQFSFLCQMLPVSLLSILDCPISFLSCVRCCLYLYYPFLIVLSVFFLVSDVACISIIHSWLSHQFFLCQMLSVSLLSILDYPISFLSYVSCCLYLYYPFLIVPSVFVLMSDGACVYYPFLIVSSVFFLVSDVACISIIHSWLSHQFSFLCQMLPVSLLSILDCPISFLSCVRCCLYLYYPFLIVLSVFFLVSDVACISIIHSWLSHQFPFLVRCCLYLYYPLFFFFPSPRQENTVYWVLTLRACPFCTAKCKSYIQLKTEWTYLHLG